MSDELVSIKFSATERDTHKRCRRKWDYGSLNRQSLTPLVPGLALVAGTLHHKVMDNWCKALLAGVTNFDPLENLDLISADTIHKTADHYKAVVGAKMNRVELTPVFDAIQFERAMIRMYADYWGGPIQEGFKLVQSEQTIVVPVCEAPCAYCDGSGRQNVYERGIGEFDCLACKGHGLVQLELEGTLDAIAEREDLYYVVERKTYDKRPNMDYLNFFDQGTTYAWMMQELGWKLGGIAYDGMWRRDHVPKGNTLDSLFLRTLLTRNDYELNAFKAQLVEELRDMNLSMAGGAKLYPNRRWEGCYDCGYRRLCDAQTKGEDFEYLKERYYIQRDRTPAYEVEVEA